MREGGQKRANEGNARVPTDRRDRPTARHIHIHILFLPDPVPFIIETGKLSNQFSSWNEKQPINDHEHDSDWVGLGNGDGGREGEGDPLPIEKLTELTRLALFLILPHLEMEMENERGDRARARARIHSCRPNK